MRLFAIDRSFNKHPIGGDEQNTTLSRILLLNLVRMAMFFGLDKKNDGKIVGKLLNLGMVKL